MTTQDFKMVERNDLIFYEFLIPFNWFMGRFWVAFRDQ
ncbi:hypothetical protein SSYIS1_04930 [Serratia symbiotica]|uniref:Uncharacterized protein n=1 Tax=Serratia symbiotica TaxID=138074 RepID=A0A455VE48_9GAMM|nr:hypothetical protein SSYIS1_04930 [Serratia symbiotica]